MTEDELIAEIRRLRDALDAWEKFAYYAAGESGHTAVTMPLWCALLFERACQATDSLRTVAPQ